MNRRVPVTATAMAAIAATTTVFFGAHVRAEPANSPGSSVTPPPPVDPKMTRTGLLRTESLTPERERLYIASSAMRRVIEVDVLRGAGDGPHPTLYLLDGVDGEKTSGWLTKGGAEKYFADKPVDVVLTSGGTGSMYSDWQRQDAALGLNRWETFLTSELPPIVESMLKSDGNRAIAGVSMGAQAAMMLAQRHPGRYRAVAGMSGCYSTADPLGHAVTAITVASRGGNVENLWGPPSSPEWAAHDSVLGAERLRGTAVYLSAASGAPTSADLVAVANATDMMGALSTAGGGAALEAGARACTERLVGKLGELRIPVTVDYSDLGMHTWVDFEAQLPRAWKVLAPALGLPEPQQ